MPASHRLGDVAEDSPARAAAQSARRLCICIDDVGLHAGVNAAALALVQCGRVHTLGALVGAPAWREAAAALAGMPRGQVDLGLHLDLTECPLLRSTRRPLFAWMAAAASRRIDRRPLREEIEAQLDTFATALGRPPDFVDGHQHVHQLPVVREVLLEALAERGAQPRPWLRNSHPRAAAGALKAHVIERAGSRGLQALAAARGWPQNARLLGVYDFRGGIVRYRSLADRWLHFAHDGDLLMCHPSAATAPSPFDPLLPARRAEFDHWGSGPAGAALERERIMLQPMSRICAEPAAAAAAAAAAAHTGAFGASASSGA